MIVGTSGSGKTTLMRMINRLVEPTSGARPHRWPGHARRARRIVLRRRIGYAIQGHGLFPHRTVAQNIGTVPKLLGWDRAKIAARVDELLTLFQLDPGAVPRPHARRALAAASSSASASPGRSRRSPTCC